MQKCYCGHQNRQRAQSQSSCSGTGHSSQHLRSSQRVTQFVQCPVKQQKPKGLGLGHSNSGLSGQFSRCNSTTSTSYCSSCCSSCSSPQQRQQSRVKVLSWGNERALSGSDCCEHTDNRRLYEQRACVMASEGQGRQPLSQPQQCEEQQQLQGEELQHLLALQQFRLLNVNECFSTKRQDELRLRRAYDNIELEKHQEKWHKNRSNETKQKSSLTETTTSTPYALRQKLLKLQLQAEQHPGSGPPCATLDRSCALRYNS